MHLICTGLNKFKKEGMLLANIQVLRDRLGWRIVIGKEKGPQPMRALARWEQFYFLFVTKIKFKTVQQIFFFRSA